MAELKNLVQLTDDQVKKYIREISESKNEVLHTLSEKIGKDQVAKYLYYLDNHDVLADPPKLDFKPGPGAVVRNPDIRSLCEEQKLPLIDPADSDRLEAASYQLRLGSRYRVRDAPEWLTDAQPYLTIPPHGIALVTTYEWLNIPGYLIARWNLKVRMVYRGLVWVGSLQVDPGYQGFLFCPLYNLSDQPQVLMYRQPLFIIDFVLTTPASKYDLWAGPRYSTFDFDRLDAKIRSAPEHSFEIMRQDIAKLSTKTGEDIAGLERRMERFQDSILVVIGIILAALAIIATFGLTGVKWERDWIPFVVAVFALVMSAIAIFVAVKKAKKSK